MGGTTQKYNENNDDNKNDKGEDNQKYEKKRFFLFQPRQQNMHMSIVATNYVSETKMYAKNNQYKVTVDKDNLEYIDSASDTVGIGGGAWVIEEFSNRTVTVAGYDNRRTIQ